MRAGISDGPNWRAVNKGGAKTVVGPSIHLAHDWLVGLRGGEWVLDRLARLYGPTTLYTLVNNGRGLTSAIDDCEVVTSPLQRWPQAAGRLRRWYFPLMRHAVEQITVRPCDLLLSTSSAVMKSIKPPAGVPHLCYCHSPARYAWDQTHEYAHGARGALRRAGLHAIRGRFQEWDRRTASRVTQFIANSAHTAKKIERFYDRESVVVYPPVRTRFFTEDSSVAREEWYLVVSALEPYKRVDLAVDAANRDGFRLKVAGGGSQSESIRDRAGPTVELLGRVDDETLRGLYRRARALLHPQREDFGIVAVEAQACGCPVMAFAAGGALETVTEATGVFFDEQRVEPLCQAVREFKAVSIDSHACRRNARRFDESVFDRAMTAQVADLLGLKSADVAVEEVQPAVQTVTLVGG